MKAEIEIKKRIENIEREISDMLDEQQEKSMQKISWDIQDGIAIKRLELNQLLWVLSE